MPHLEVDDKPVSGFSFSPAAANDVVIAKTLFCFEANRDKRLCHAACAAKENGKLVDSETNLSGMAEVMKWLFSDGASSNLGCDASGPDGMSLGSLQVRSGAQVICHSSGISVLQSSAPHAMPCSQRIIISCAYTYQQGRTPLLVKPNHTP